MLKEELGDILLQIMLHAQIAYESNEFSLPDVIQTLVQKLLRRHPHVFGDDEANTPKDVEVKWDANKLVEKERTSVLEGIPSQMPALAYSQSIHRRAATAGFDWENTDGVLEKLNEEVSELQNSESKEQQEKEIGDILSVLVNLGRKLDIDMETALRKSNQRFRKRFTTMEELCRDKSLQLKCLTFDQQEALWKEAKHILSPDNKSDG